MSSLGDQDPIETQEWRDALASVLEFEGKERAEYILSELSRYANECGIASAGGGITTAYLNTLPEASEAKLPDDGVAHQQLMAYIRWNAMILVLRASAKKEGLGGHISSHAGIADLFGIGLDYVFRGRNDSKKQLGDLVYFQGHSSEGIYARAFLEGRISKKQMENFRQEIFDDGLSSYPHPHLMPEFWQFATVSLGLSLVCAIYQAQFLRYLQHRNLLKTDDRHVWLFCGDGEMSEVESTGALWVAARDKLDNLTFVISCNMQRLDGPVCGNGQIIQELAGVFAGAGWNVIKVIWGGNWYPLFQNDTQGFLRKRISELVDGEWQGYESKDAAYFREHFFGKYPELATLVADMSDEALKQLQDGGHDPQKIYASYQAALEHKGQPTVILAKTVKGYGVTEAAGLNIAHNVDEVSVDALKAFCKRFDLPLTDKQIKNLEFAKPPENSPAIKFLHAQRKKLGGYMPVRVSQCEKLKIPDLSLFDNLLQGFGDREIASTMAFVRALTALLKDKNIGDRIVPIVADEARTLGMEGLFRQVGIYAPEGQKYTPEDRKQLLYYREDAAGQLMQQGITETGSMATWVAAGTSYATNALPMIPFYVYYSMFGYQRVGDLCWASGDMMVRGFLVGGTSGRTTLAGEGLQHQDGQNALTFGLIPSCQAYDLCFAYEIAVIVHKGLQRMYVDQEDVFYYITMMNESYQHPPMPKGAEEDIIKGMYLFLEGDKKSKHRVQLLGSGAIFREVIKAAEILHKEFKVSADVWGVTSFNQLRRDQESVDRYHRLNPDKKAKVSHVAKCLGDRKGPVIAATDYVRLFAEQISPGLSQPYHVLGTDGYGRSDNRVNLRDFFEVDAKMIAYTALSALADEGAFSKAELKTAMKKLNIDAKRPDPWTV
ncbi:MAG: pyruvate dehydrogenase (acetyl-transferring), homodimeric type [Gammaproteobacteria bacterium]|nr:pyruvate dehydrogenase (acetyl-transferring), homodimeric type [Gammaproteobacteria bacterium]MCH9744710.1 pyruvate dehydrogenase (acetyl-transferring), homodimeric type [Gammaproteobacteria bacterium]